MVLKKSKWDRKATRNYLKKHDLLPAPSAPEVRPKWSSKKREKAVVIDPDAWDSETEDALINHFYPQLGSNVSEEQRKEIRESIVEKLQEETEKHGEDGQDEEDSAESENITSLLSLLSQKPRKLLETKTSDNFLEEYGLESYKDLAKEGDYDAIRKPRTLEEISAAELDGLAIGSTSEEPMTLTEEDIRADEERRKKVQQKKLYDDMRRRFVQKEHQNGRVLDLNNASVDLVNKKLATEHHVVTDAEFNEGLRELLGNDIKLESQRETDSEKGDQLAGYPLKETRSSDIDQLVSGVKKVGIREKMVAPSSKFLDDLLG